MRNQTLYFLAFAIAGVVATMICSSCIQEQKLADVRDSASGRGTDSTTAMSWRATTSDEADTTERVEIESVPERKQASSGLLDPSTERCIRNYGPVIKRYSGRYGLDWRLVLAIMKQESCSSLNSGSHNGVDGLIQLMPARGADLVRKLGLEDPSPPEHVIQTAIFYLRSLYNLFEGSAEADRLKLTVAAYIAGVARVYDAQELAVYLHDEPTQWLAIKDALPLLSKQFSTLHRTIWGQDKPRSGWFGNSRETIQYVNSVMDNYDAFRLALN